MPSSSIIIPVHNRAALTRQCLNALLEQPYRDGNPEFIVVDDASTDLTLRLLSGYGDAIKVIHHASNQGFG